MEKYNSNTAMIDAYLAGELSKSDRAQFEAELAEQKDLRQALADYQDLLWEKEDAEADEEWTAEEEDIVKLVDGRLGRARYSEFKQKIHRDTEFKNRFIFELALDQAMSDLAEQRRGSTRNEKQDDQALTLPRPQAIVRSLASRPWRRIAATFLIPLLLGVGGYLYLSRMAKWVSTDTYTAHLAVIIGADKSDKSGTGGAGKSLRSAFQEINQLVERQRFSEAIDASDALLEIMPNDQHLPFLKASCIVNLAKPSASQLLQAEDILQQLIDEGSYGLPFEYYTVVYHLGLCYEKMGDPQRARQQFEILADEDCSNYRFVSSCETLKQHALHDYQH